MLSRKLKVTILDKEYTVEKDTLIHIPPFHEHTIEVLEDTSLFDYGGEMDLMALLVDLESVKKYKPEILEDPIQKKLNSCINTVVILQMLLVDNIKQLNTTMSLSLYNEYKKISGVSTASLIFL